MEIKELKSRLEGINNWIKDNPNTDPNMYEIMDCTIELGKIARRENVMYMDGKHPAKGTELAELYSEYQKMTGARLSYDKVSKDDYIVQEDSPLYELYFEIMKISQMGEYFEHPDGIGDKKKQLLCSLSGVGLYIQQQKRARENGSDVIIYDNTAEFEKIKELLSEVKECEPYTQGIVQMENLLAEIGREYELSMQEKNKDEKTNNFASWKNEVVDFEDVEYTERESVGEAQEQIRE